MGGRFGLCPMKSKNYAIRGRNLVIFDDVNLFIILAGKGTASILIL